MSERNGGWTITDHAWDRMIPMGVARTDVLRVLQDPEQSYDQADREEGTRVFQRGDLAVVAHVPTKRVVTVVWRCQEKWHRRDDQAKAR